MASELSRRLEQAQERKAIGNSCVSSGDFRTAAFNYKQVPLFIEQYVSLKGTAADKGEGDKDMGMASMLAQQRGEATYKPTSDEQKVVDALFASVQSNLALCHLRLGRYDKAREAAGVAIALMEHYGAPLSKEKPGDPNSPIGRAYYRRALAHLNIYNLEEAREDLMRIGGEKEPVAAEQLAVLRVKEAEVATKEKKLYKNMFAA
jgi:tetratricopeptide (TPR) repeat protein